MNESDIICDYCNEIADSPEHQLFECNVFECEERHLLLGLLNHNIHDFKWGIITLNNMVDDQQQITKLFVSLANQIEIETQNIWNKESMS